MGKAHFSNELATLCTFEMCEIILNHDFVFSMNHQKAKVLNRTRSISSLILHSRAVYDQSILVHTFICKQQSLLIAMNSSFCVMLIPDMDDFDEVILCEGEVKMMFFKKTSKNKWFIVRIDFRCSFSDILRYTYQRTICKFVFLCRSSQKYCALSSPIWLLWRYKYVSVCMRG